MQAEDQQTLELQNAEVKGWFTVTLRMVKARYMQLVHSPGRSGEGLDSIKSRTRESYGEIDSGSFSFNRYLIFIHKGAGRGMGGTKGSQWTDIHGNARSTDPHSLGKMNTGSRHAEEWLNPVLDEQVPQLADIVAKFKTDAVINQIQIK